MLNTSTTAAHVQHTVVIVIVDVGKQLESQKPVLTETRRKDPYPSPRGHRQDVPPGAAFSHMCLVDLPPLCKGIVVPRAEETKLITKAPSPHDLLAFQREDGSDLSSSTGENRKGL